MGQWPCKERAGEGPKGDQGCGARAERTSNMDSMVVTLDVSRLSGWLNADALCPAEKRAVSVCGPGKGGRVGATSNQAGEARIQVGAEARTEHTLNMAFMVMTPEVFQPEMFALKYAMSMKSSDMSVMAETPQSAMGPYCAMAKIAS